MRVISPGTPRMCTVMTAFVRGVILRSRSLRIHGQAVVDFADDRDGFRRDDAGARGEKGIAVDDHFIAGPDADSHQRADERRGARVDRQRMLRAEAGRKNAAPVPPPWTGIPRDRSSGTGICGPAFPAPGASPRPRSPGHPDTWVGWGWFSLSGPPWMASGSMIVSASLIRVPPSGEVPCQFNERSVLYYGTDCFPRMSRGDLTGRRWG